MDLGLRNARINFRQSEKSHLMENMVYNELRMRGFNVDVGVVPVIHILSATWGAGVITYSRPTGWNPTRR